MRGSLCTIIFSFIFVSACNYHVNKNGDSNANQSLDTISGDQVIGWELMRSTVLKTCLDCHSGRQTPILSSYTSMVAALGKVWGEVQTRSMPPQSSGLLPLSVCKTAVLKKWIDLAAPETSKITVASVPECPQNQGPSIPIDRLPLNYQTLKNEILLPRCIHCHNASDTTDAGAILFSPYSELRLGERRWSIPAAQSKVVRLLRSTDVEERMPPPESGVALDEDEIQFIERWIDAGKPEF